MDTSETYIKMCEKAENILPHINIEPEDFMMNGSRGSMGASIWLPRQDQLQEMVPHNEKNNFDWMCQLSKLEAFTVENYDHGQRYPEYIWNFSTWEQLWLAYVMKEKYNKVWNGEDWK